MAVTAIQDGLALTLTEVKAFLKVETTAEDAFLTTAIAAVKKLADDVCQSEFLDDDGEPDAIPETVKLWVLAYIGRVYERRAAGLVRESISMLGSVEWGEADMDLLLTGNKSYNGNDGVGVCPI